MSSIGSPGSRRIAPCSSETCLRSRSRSARVSEGSAARRRLSRWPWAAVAPRIGLLSWQWVFEIRRQIFPPRVAGGEGGSHGVHASQHLRGGEAARDDLSAIGDFPVPVAGRTVRRNVVSV